MNYIKIDSLSDNSRNSYSKLQQQQQHVRESSRNFQDTYEDSNNCLITHKQNNLISKLNTSQLPINQHQQQQLNYSKTINTNSPFYITNKHNNVTPPLHQTLLNPQSNQLNNNKNINIHEPRQLRKFEKICDSDSEDEETDKTNTNKYVIMPDNILKGYFDFIISLIIIYSSIVYPYKLSFNNDDQNESPSDNIIETIFTLFLFIDLILNFFSAYIDTEDNIIKHHKTIITNYIKSWFIIDILSLLPYNYIFKCKNQTSYKTIARLIRLPKIYRLLRTFKVIRMIKLLKNKNSNSITTFILKIINIPPNIERLIYFIFVFLLLNHIAACIWYYVAKIENFNPNSWVTRLGYSDSSHSEIYIISFYWTLTTVTTVGYGDINAGTTIERVYNLCLMLFGVIMYSFAIGSLNSIISTLDSNTAEMNQKLQILSSIKREFNLDQEIYDKVRKIIKSDLSRNQKDKIDFLKELPNKLRIELSHIMHDGCISKMYFFKNQSNDFIAYVAPLLKMVKFSQNDYLYKCNDIIDEMYFVSKGTVVFCLTKEYNEYELKEVKKGNNFGEIEMCLNEKLTYDIKVKSRSCELFVLKKNDFLKLSVNFKEFIESFLQRSLLLYLKFMEDKMKVIEEINEIQKLRNDIKGFNNGDNNNNNNKKQLLERIDELEESSFNEEDFVVSEGSGSEFSSEKDEFESDKEREDDDDDDEEDEDDNNKLEEQNEVEQQQQQVIEHNNNNSLINKSKEQISDAVCISDKNVNQQQQQQQSLTNNNCLNIPNSTNNNQESSFICNTSNNNNNISHIQHQHQQQQQPHYDINILPESPKINDTIQTNKTKHNQTQASFNVINNIELSSMDEMKANPKLKKTSMNNLLSDNLTLFNIKPTNTNQLHILFSPIANRNHNKKDITKNPINTIDNNPETLKSQINQKFIKKVNKVIDFIEKNTKMNFDKKDIILTMLNKLTTLSNLTERNEIIENIETILNNVYNKD